MRKLDLPDTNRPAIVILAGLFSVLPINVHSAYAGKCAEPTKTLAAIGTSMTPYLYDGQALQWQPCQAVKRGRMVVAEQGDRKIVKWLVAVPGDTVAVTADGQIEVNDRIARTREGKPYRFSGTRLRNMQTLAGTVPDGKYLLLGNRPFGTDDSSRYGWFDEATIAGTARPIEDGPRVAVVDFRALERAGWNRDTVYPVLGEVARSIQVGQVVSAQARLPENRRKHTLDITNLVESRLSR